LEHKRSKSPVSSEDDAKLDSKRLFRQIIERLKVNLAIILFTSLFLSLFSLTAYIHTKLVIFFNLFGVTMILNFLWFMGISSLLTVEREMKIISPSRLSGTKGFEGLMAFFCLAMVAMLLIIWHGIYIFNYWQSSPQFLQSLNDS
jgi:hypothetical protein